MNSQIDPQAIINEFKKGKQELSRLTDNYKNFGIQKETAERKYRIELRKTLINLRANKTPSNIINDIAKGDEYISKLRYERGLAENNYNTCREAINNKRLEIETLRSVLKWMGVEFNNS